MKGTAGTKGRIVAAGAAILVVVGMLAAFAGSASAAPVAPAGGSTTSWAYGGSNTTASGNFSIGKLNATWSATIDVAVIFNATPTVTDTTELEVQRTVGVTIQISASAPEGTLAFNFHATEADKAYANITNDSTVYVAGAPVAALGIDNASFHGSAALAESLVAKGLTKSASAYLNVSALASAKVSFAPSLGLVPLDLTGITAWNSSAEASPSANWNFAYNYAFHGWNDTTKSGSGTHTGEWNTKGPVTLTGQVDTLGIPHFSDHQSRTGIQLSVAGPASLYDGFVVLPRGYNIFAGAQPAYSGESMSNVTISSERLFLTPGHVRATSFTAAELRIGGASGRQPLVAATGATSLFPANAGVGSGSVVAQPESVSTAEGQSHCIEFGCASAAPWFSGLVAVAVIGGLIAAVAGTVGVVEWRSYARRKNQAQQLVGGYSEGLTSGFPPAAVPPSGAAPPAPMAGPSNPPEGPGRQT